MNCPNCNTLNDDSARFCSSCGDYLDRKAADICPDCGTERKKGDPYCIICGYKFAGSRPPLQPAPSSSNFGNTGDRDGYNGSTSGGYQSGPSHNFGPNTIVGTNGDNVRFASFGERLVALIIDSVILGVAGGVLGLLFAFADDNGVFINFLSLILGIAYKAGMEGSSNQATLGKMAMGIKVIGPDGGRISYGRAIGRYFATILSSLILGIGYLMALWTKEKRTLHDFIADTYVIKK
ncbi:RDD family protein [Bacillus sp. FJAT-27245]|uniref:RDD family protein n=1 Tax=Bacillus sp. FJAT-27245 TaxID=1684144 RepID=UPI0006A7C840|nr:RDD family protein [Bacillus sp. FJAT-27245]